MRFAIVTVVGVLGVADPVCTSREPLFGDTEAPATGTPGSAADSKASSAGACGPGDVEPNDDRAMATDLGEFTSDLEARNLAAAIGGGDSSDWYTLSGRVIEGDPADVTMDVVSAEPGLQVCAFVLCHNPPNQGLYCRDRSDVVAFEEVEGCCGAGPISVMHSCHGSPGGNRDHAQVWIQVQAPEGVACVDYTLWYGF